MLPILQSILGSPKKIAWNSRKTAGTYEAVFISKLTCQLSSFFVQIFVQTTSTLCKTTTTLCKTTSTLCKERRQLCTNNVHTLYEQHQLCTNNVNFVRTTSSLYEQRQLCKDNDNFVRIMFTLCTNNVNFVRTTSSLYEQRQLCTNNVEVTRNYRLTWAAFGNCRLFQYGGLYRSQNCSRIASGKTMLIIKISTFLFTWRVKDNVCRVKTRVKQWILCISFGLFPCINI